MIAKDTALLSLEAYQFLCLLWERRDALQKLTNVLDMENVSATQKPVLAPMSQFIQNMIQLDVPAQPAPKPRP